MNLDESAVLQHKVVVKVKGIDTQKKAIQLARKNCSSTDCEVEDIFEVNDQFDYLLASEVIEHLERKSQVSSKNWWSVSKRNAGDDTKKEQ